MPKLQLHMHQVRSFIDDRYSFWQQYQEDKKPRFHYFKGVENAFVVGSAIDAGIKQYYLNKNNGNAVGDKIISNKFFINLKKTDKVMVNSLLNAYISQTNFDNKEYFCNFRFDEFQTPMHNFVIYSRPDLIASFYLEPEDDAIIEIKSSGDTVNGYSAETLDFQTATYCWAYFYKYAKIPKCVIKRTLMKPRIRVKKNETESEYIQRFVEYVGENEDKLIKEDVREVTLETIIEFEKYLWNILLELDYDLKSNNKYKFWRKSNEYWG